MMPLIHRSTIARKLGLPTLAAMVGMVPLFVDRLLICPWLSRQWGEAQFGGFIWAVGAANLFGLCWCNGVATTILRHYTDISADERQVLVKHLLIISELGTLGISLLAALASACFGPAEAAAAPWQLLVPLVGFSCIRAISTVQVALLRVTGRFQAMILVRLLEAAVLLTIFVVPRIDFLTVCLIYCASAAAAMPWTWRLLGGNMGQTASASRDWVPRLLPDTCYGAGLTLLDQSQAYAARLILGALLLDSTGIAHFYAATSIGGLFVMPVSLAGGAVLSIVAGKSAAALQKKTARRYLGLTLAASAAVGVCSYFLGLFCVGWLYPRSLESARTFFYWIALGNAGTAVLMLLRPMAIRYTSLRGTLLASGSASAVQIVCLVVFVLLQGVAGAAAAVGLSNALTAVAWSFAYKLTVIDRSREVSNARDIAPVINPSKAA